MSEFSAAFDALEITLANQKKNYVFNRNYHIFFFYGVFCVSMQCTFKMYHTTTTTTKQQKNASHIYN